ncbi:TonB-dependent receptor [Sulfurimicrobium lacus]|uniref:TonB-dependent receptor n=1 Tax=Sulfurimicrobium lacus TaxID=2715678 RepID=A0A6F8VG32_9PROT|nr:TonB-dependent receptor [Sulfurimicrobium lacus]BCB27986.1 TonB-dependent receptor [Sulfurimicrobium lacus]
MDNKFRLRPLAVLIASLVVSSAYAQDDAVKTDDISVFGQGQTRQVQNISKKDIEDAAPGTSPLKVLDKVPGVHFESSDTFGAYEWSTSISVRGFSANQLGYTLDDIPLGDLSYGNHNGLHISRAISSENLGRVQVSQGTGSIDTASTSNLGGTMQFYSTDPDEQFGVTASQMLGENSARRTYVRLDSGRLANGGKLYISAVDQNSDKWKGHGEQRNKQVNAKYVQFFGESKLSAFVNWSDRQEVDYQDLSKEMLGRLGYKWDNYYPDWNKAIQSSQNIWTSGETSVDDAYYAGSGIREDYLSGVTLDAKLSDNLRWKNTVYHHSNKGAGLWWTPYVLSPVSNTPSVRTTEYDIDRTGLLSSLTYTLGNHKLNGGLWYENDDFTQARRYYATTATDPRTPYEIPSGPFRTDWAFNYTEKTMQWYAQDTITVSPKLTVNAGFKSPKVDVTGTETTGADRPSGSITSKKSFLPQLSMVYKLDDSNELFAGVAQNMRAIYTQPFGTTRAGFAAIQGNLNPETSTTYEGGWRFQGNKLDGVVSLYHVDFKDRLLSIGSGAGIVGSPSVLANVGKVESNGMDLGLNWKFASSWSWFNSLSFNSTQYKDNYLDGVNVRNVSGKQVVGVPEQMFKTELAYDNGTWFARLGGDYTSKRYYTYSNDNSVDGRWLWNLGAGYRVKNVGFFKEVKAQVNINNLLNKEYFASMGTNGFSYSDPTGTGQTLQTGAPRQAFINVTGKF